MSPTARLLSLAAALGLFAASGSAAGESAARPRAGSARRPPPAVSASPENPGPEAEDVDPRDGLGDERDTETGEPDSDGQGAGDGTEDLQQLLAQAQELARGGAPASRGQIEALCRALESLLSALRAESSTLEGGAQEAEEPEPALRAGRAGLERALADDGEEEGDAGEDPEDEAGGATAERGRAARGADSLGRLRGYVDLALDAVQRIQELRGARREAYEEEASGGGEASSEASGERTGRDEGEDGQEEEKLAEVSGVVEDEDGPVAGAVVSDLESGASAVTDEAGAYTLSTLPRGLADLVIRKDERQIGAGRVDISRERARVADFLLRTGRRAEGGPARSALLRVLASRVVVSPGLARERAGRIEGVVEDGRGRPTPRALIRLLGLARARSDARGRFVFTRVPPGPRRLLASGAEGASAARSLVVDAARTTPTRLVLEAGIRARLGAGRGLLLDRREERRAAAAVRGFVRDEQGRSLPGARVTLRGERTAVSVRTSAGGRFVLRRLRPGSYRLWASRSGRVSHGRTLSLRPGAMEDVELRLSPGTSPVPMPGPWRGPRVQAEVRGLVSGAGRAVRGARVELRGRSRGAPDVRARTDSGGHFVLRAPPGRYSLRVGARSWRDQSVGVTLRAGSVERRSFELRTDRPPDVRRRSRRDVERRRPGALPSPPPRAPRQPAGALPRRRP